ncbi:Orn/Lys/Arg decarboxylase N-terminal domain-containing protein [Alcaligenes endophyticus]|uniref:Arginine decarboxylase n=1 Tax=Alcaligenes endophyticus TaxID=1929088 RepID=A0ABT8EJU7_9BURK|nr:Orn/Lys/Arg decarboxylase N-terminal domain-containing protein [Alcaligenes endophyticus]MCX5591875.1 arginine decarboxylase [Alcaligenes endophyticus]MDN4121564.1 arginine decarboxylase [Alcaligenes endophyticus]
MKFNHNALFVLSDAVIDNAPALESIHAIEDAVMDRGFDVHVAQDIHAALIYVKKSPSFSSVALAWDAEHPEACQQLVSLIRERNASVPIFLLSEGDVSARIPITVLQAVSEYVHLYSETPEFTANRLYTAAYRYADKLLPPYFKTLKDFTEDGDYYWDCPGHMGGMAYMKHPVGIEFINFFGENIMRADIGVATAEMGDYLVHAGPPKKSEDLAAKLFGADWTFYGVAGSSGSNRIVAQGAAAADEIAIVDRNCHKSLNHGLTLSQARPVYLTPSRNGYGLIGPIPAHRLQKHSIQQLIHSSALTAGAVSPEPTYAVVTNCTYDGFCYNVQDVVKSLGQSVPRIHFDEAWYAYAKFHPLYKDRFAMDVDESIPNRPTIFAVQSTHKMLPALSMASMIHVKKSERAPLDYDDFNDAFMMHGTTSPFYPIIASIDVAVAMMQGEAGRSLVQESVEEAVAFRQAVVNVKHALAEEEGAGSWFFDVLQPTEVSDSQGKSYPFHQAPMSLLSQNPDVWRLGEDEAWHGFAKEDLAGTDCMLDPVKVSITCPGITAAGQYEKMGIPGYVVTKFLDDRRIEIARTGDYTLLILFSVGITKGKWGTLIESLLEFKRLYDTDALVSEAIPSLTVATSAYENMTLKELCTRMHSSMQELDLMTHIHEAVSTTPEAVLTPAQAYQKVVRYKTEKVKVNDFAGRVSAAMLVPYPPGIPVLMPGERLPSDDTGIIGYLNALQEFDKRFPGFEHEIQGVKIDQNGDYWVRAIVEEERDPQAHPQHITFKKPEVSVIKKGRQ